MCVGVECNEGCSLETSQGLGLSTHVPTVGITTYRLFNSEGEGEGEGEHGDTVKLNVP